MVRLLLLYSRELAFFYPDFVAPTIIQKRKKKRLQRTLALIRPDALRTRRGNCLCADPAISHFSSLLIMLKTLDQSEVMQKFGIGFLLRNVPLPPVFHKLQVP